jgi:hypothetical protein
MYTYIVIELYVHGERKSIMMGRCTNREKQERGGENQIGRRVK